MNIDKSRILELDEQMSTIDSDIASSISFVRRAQGLSVDSLGYRLSGINSSTLKRYLQPSYTCIRPLHVVAALSWLMMVPMTAFYTHLRTKESYRGMDDLSLNALQRVGKLPQIQFEHYMEMITNLLGDEEKEKFRNFRINVESKNKDYDIIYDELLPPKSLDIDAFAIDYYRSVAITMRSFRIKNKLNPKELARILGLSLYQYNLLEDKNVTRDLPVAVGFRVKLAFELYSHVNFTSEMKVYHEFHRLRKVQHIRDALLIEAFRLMSPIIKEQASKIITNLSDIYIKNMM